MKVDLNRLKELKNEIWLESWNNLILVDELELVKNENVIEYENIKQNVERSLIDRFTNASKSFFESINLRDFDLIKVKKDLEAIGLSQWNERLEEDIVRDGLLDIYCEFYRYQYESAQRYKDLQEINNQRLITKDKIKCLLTKFFKRQILVSFRRGRITKLFVNGNDIKFFVERSTQAFQQRSDRFIERDTFGYFEVEDYQESLRNAFFQAKTEAQSEIRNNISGKIKKFITERIATQHPPDYYLGLDYELNNFVTDLFEKRDSDTNNKESSLLITAESYREWTDQVSAEIKSEYQKHDPGDCDILWMDYDLGNEDSANEKYGGYNGFDDDTIDDAFDGDPRNTWNVD